MKNSVHHKWCRRLAACMGLTAVLLSGCGGGAGSDEAAPSSVQPVVTFSVQPAATSAAIGKSVTFSVRVVGNGLSYQWQVSTDGGLTWTDIALAVQPDLTLLKTSVDMNGWAYRVAVRSGATTAYSQAAVLFVSPAALAGAPYDISIDGSGKAYIAALPNVSTNSNQFAAYVQTLDLATGAIETLAGSATAGFVNGKGAAVQFNGMESLVGDAHGNIYVSDLGNAVIRKVSATGEVSTFAGNGKVATTNGPLLQASFVGPRGLAFDAQGNLYVADQFGFNIRKIGTDGTVSALAGGTTSGSADGVGAAARFSGPVSLVAGPDGCLYVADGRNGVRKVSTTGVVSTLTNKVEATALAVDGAGNVYVSTWAQFVIHKVAPDGTVSVFAGSDYGLVDGIGTAARFATPYGMAVDAFGNVWVADTGNHAIRKITPAGVVTTEVR